MGKKASQASLDAVAEALKNKADASALSSKADQSKLDDLAKTVAAKASQTDVDKAIGAKADTSKMRELSNALATKANQVYVDTAVKRRADTTWVKDRISAAQSTSGALLASKNLSELTDKSAARTSLGLGALATKNSLSANEVGALDTATASATYLAKKQGFAVGEFHFTCGTCGSDTSAYKDPEPRVERDAKFGGRGIATMGLFVQGDAKVTGLLSGNFLTPGIKSSDVADYVFEPDYKLMPLAEVEAFTKSNKHLPEVPSAAEIEKSGLDLAKMNLILLKKVEELTLHTIELEKRLKAVEAKN